MLQLFYIAKNAFLAVYASLRWLNNVNCLFMSFLLITSGVQFCIDKEDWLAACISLRVDGAVLRRGGHRHLQIGRMLDIDLLSEPPHAPSPRMYVSKVWESVWPEGQEAIHS